MIRKLGLIGITTVSSLLLFDQSVLAAPAVVQSDPVLGFDNIKLQQELTTVSDKSKSLNIQFYSLNSISNERAVTINDRFISTGNVSGNSYVTLVYNRLVTDSSKGSFSANVGADFRSYITKEEIDSDIVRPNIKRFLPQNPQGFIPVVAEGIRTKIEGKIAFNNSVSFFFNSLFIIVFIIVMLAVIYTSYKTVIYYFKDKQDLYNKYEDLVESINTNYSKLVEQSTYLNGYTGETKAICDRLLVSINNISELYLTIKLPSFKEALFNKPSWDSFVVTIDNINRDIDATISYISNFLEHISVVSGTDPIAEINRQNKLKHEAEQYKELLDGATKLYAPENSIRYVSVSPVHRLYQEVVDAQSYEVRRDVYSRFYSTITLEDEKISLFVKTKQAIKDLYKYVVTNNNTYYTDPISFDDNTYVSSLAGQASNLTDYNYDIDALNKIKQELELFVTSYKQQDKDYNNTKELRDQLIKDLSITNLSTKLTNQRDNLTNTISQLPLDNRFYETAKTLEGLKSNVKQFVVDAKKYKEAKAKLSSYSSSRKQTLTRHLDNEDYNSFNAAIITYTNEDKRPSYSSSSNRGYSSGYSSSSSSDSSWSSSSSSDWSSSSSSSDSSW